MALKKEQLKLGMKVQDWNANVGVVKWIGKLEKADKPPDNNTGTYAAVQFDDARPNSPFRTDGTWNGKRRCECPPHTCEFLKWQNLSHDQITGSMAAVRTAMGDAISDFDDITLGKFCVARKFKTADIVKMITDYKAWVAKFKPSADEYFDPGFPKDYPAGFSGYDREGNIVMVERAGNAGACSPAKFIDKYGVNTVVRWHVANIETAKRMMREPGCTARRVTSIVCLKDLGSKSMKVKKFAEAIAKIDQDNYPEHLARLFLINAPTSFVVFWKMIRVFVDDRTKAKIQIFGKDFKEVHKYVDPAQLPPWAGGTSDQWMSRGGIIGALEKTENTPAPVLEAVIEEEGGDEILPEDGEGSEPQESDLKEVNSMANAHEHPEFTSMRSPSAE